MGDYWQPSLSINYDFITNPLYMKKRTKLLHSLQLSTKRLSAKQLRQLKGGAGLMIDPDG